jgi:hypothetical protein
MEKETTPIEKWIEESTKEHTRDIGYQATFVSGCNRTLTYLGLSDIPDPKKWVEERKANMYKETLAKIDLDKFNFEGRCKQLEAENEKLKEILSELRYFSNLHLDHSLMKQIEDVVK